MELVVAMDTEGAGRKFFDKQVVIPAMGLLSGNHRIIITSLKRGDALCLELIRLGVGPERICRTDSGGGTGSCRGDSLGDRGVRDEE